MKIKTYASLISIVTATTIASVALSTYHTSTIVDNSNIDTTTNADIAVKQENEETKTINKPKKTISSEENRVTEIVVQFVGGPHHNTPETQEGMEWIGATNVRGRVGRPFGSITIPQVLYKKYHCMEWYNLATNKEVKSTDLITDTDIDGDGKMDGVMQIYPLFPPDVDVKKCVSIGGLSDSVISIVPHGYDIKEKYEPGDLAPPSLKYSTNGIDWDKFDYVRYDPADPESGKIKISSGQTIYFRGDNPEGFSFDKEHYINFLVGGSAVLFGNVMTLIDNGAGNEDTLPNDYCFYRLFAGSAGIKCISSNFMPATTLSAHCYSFMFDDCRALTTFPSTILPVTDLTKKREGAADVEYCYEGMFRGCDSLTTIPSGLLPATKLSPYCYYGMFSDCDGLTKLESGVLPATELVEGCYDGMFANCDNINNVDKNLLVPGNANPKLAKLCYGEMFANCTSLAFDGEQIDINLPVTDLTGADRCYESMFYGCTEMTVAPQLPATTLSDSCYAWMFFNCSNLVQCPILPAKTLKTSCYENMFGNCNSLTSLAEISADTTMASYCCRRMYTKCTGFGDKLKNVHLKPTTLASHCYEEMFEYSTLTYAPFIDAQTMKDSSCKRMFYRCPELYRSSQIGSDTKKTSMATKCCYEMFRFCTSLYEAGNLYISNSESDCGAYMFSDCTNFYVDTDRGTKFFTVPGSRNHWHHMFQITYNRETSNPEIYSGDNWCWVAHY